MAEVIEHCCIIERYSATDVKHKTLDVETVVLKGQNSCYNQLNRKDVNVDENEQERLSNFTYRYKLK